MDEKQEEAVPERIQLAERWRLVGLELKKRDPEAFQRFLLYFMSFAVSGPPVEENMLESYLES